MAQNQDEYNRAFDELTAKCEKLKEQQCKINDQLSEKSGRKRNLEAFIDKIRHVDGLIGFDEHLFLGTVDKVVVHGGRQKGEKKLVFCFKDGTEIAV